MYKLTSIIFLVFCFSCQHLYSQLDRSQILKETKVEELRRISDEAKLKYQNDLIIAEERGYPLKNFIGINERNIPVYATDYNHVASEKTQAFLLRNSLGLEGEFYDIGMWETESPLTSHTDFGNRLILIDTSLTSFHATHVGGTLIGDDGDGADATGMAPKANLLAYTIVGFLNETADAAADGLLVANHSWGTISGYNKDSDGIIWDQWTWYGGGSPFSSTGESAYFGEYDSDSEDIDNILFNAPYLLVVKAAGNDNNDNPEEDILGDDEVRNFGDTTYEDYDEDIHPAGDGGMFTNIPTWGNAKNILTIGALDKDLVLADFSSRGLTNDGRLKPDLVGIGVNVLSASNADTDAHSESNGTSMAAPNVAGSLLLLQEYYNNLYGAGYYMHAATLKALAIHTAQDIGITGPDSDTGWGLPQVSNAANVIERAAWIFSTNEHLMHYDSISVDGEQKTYTIHVSTSTDIKATLVWAESAGDDSDPVTNRELRNDLDLRLERESDGTFFYPQEVNGNGSTQDDDKNNVERVIQNVEPGRYYVSVTHDFDSTGELYLDEPQKFALIISGNNASCKHDLHHHSVNTFMGNYEVENNIFSSINLEVGDQMTYKSYGQTILQPGFHAKPGSTLITSNIGCDF